MNIKEKKYGTSVISMLTLNFTLAHRPRTKYTISQILCVNQTRDLYALNTDVQLV